MKRSKAIAPIVAILLFALLIPGFVIGTAGSEQNADMSPYDAIARIGVLPYGQENSYLTRYEALTKILWVTGEIYEAEVYDGGTSFRDAVRDQGIVLGYAESKGIIVGDGESFFYPNKSCTLSDMLIMALRVMGYSEVTAENVCELAEAVGLYKYSQADDLYFYLNGARAAECIWNMLSFDIADGTTFADLLIEKSMMNSKMYTWLCTNVSYSFGDTTAVETGARTETETTAAESETEEDTTTAPDTTETEEVTTTAPETTDPEDDGWTGPWNPWSRRR